MERRWETKWFPWIHVTRLLNWKFDGFIIHFSFKSQKYFHFEHRMYYALHFAYCLVSPSDISQITISHTLPTLCSPPSKFTISFFLCLALSQHAFAVSSNFTPPQFSSDYVQAKSTRAVFNVPSPLLTPERTTCKSTRLPHTLNSCFSTDFLCKDCYSI